MSAPASVHEVNRARTTALCEAYALLAVWGREDRQRQSNDDQPTQQHETTSAPTPVASEPEPVR